ncbi:MAG: flagellar basal body P-ring formation chaperone FlgA [Candidatus Margulisiibacteriota bacterium]
MKIRKLVLNRFWLCCLLVLFSSATAFALKDPEAKLAKVIEDHVVAAHPNWAELDIRITFKFADKTFNDLRKLSEKASFTVVDVYQDFRPVGNVIFPIQISDEEVSRKVFVRAQVEVFKPVVVVNRLIKRGETIAEGDLALVARDIAMLPDSYYEDKVMVIDTEAKTAIPKNSTIFRWMVKEIPVVRRGEELTINIKGANFLVKAQGIALMDGYLGKNVKVRKKGVKDPKKILEGLLISSKEVEVEL